MLSLRRQIALRLHLVGVGFARTAGRALQWYLAADFGSRPRL
jgi:hypothetical protein